MKKIISKLMGGVLLFGLSMSLTSCEDILGHWERPTAVPDSTPTPAPDPAPTPASEDLATPLTLEAVSGTVTVTIKTDFATGKTIEYSTDDGATWTEGTPSKGGGTDIDACANPVTITGSKIMLRGTNAAYAVDYGMGSNITKIVCSADCYIYGNVMSLINKDNFATLTAFDTTEGNFAFYHLFDGNTHIKNHAEKQLLLPATTLAMGCYVYMFNGCTSLTTAPALPAENLANSCYSHMFHGCTGLTTAPALPATTLANGCYSNMFNGCSSLTTAPELPATTLMEMCYSSMFESCTGLTTAYVKAAYTTTGDACKYMFYGCSADGAKLHTTTANKGSWSSEVPGNWTVADDWN